MGQYSTGTVSTTAGSNIVTGSGTAWSTNVTAGDEFNIAGEAVFVISSVDDDAQITLSANYPYTHSGAAYVINKDFTTNHGIPLSEAGDLNFNDLFTRAMQVIDSAIERMTLLESVLDKDVADAPAAPTDGDRYIVASGSTSGDDWEGYADYIAEYDATSGVEDWTYTAPTAGDFCLVEDEDQMYFYDGYSWHAWSIGVEAGRYTLAFDDDDLDSSGVLSVTHSLGQQWPVVAVYNGDDEQIMPDSVTATDSNTCDIDLSSYGALSGTWHVTVMG